ncbi:MAG: dihydropteroate synthase [Bacteroidales bacterium]|nr:dihydropteroate synthase [Bacteroidales bacterium]
MGTQKKITLMGIVNLTDNSYIKDSRCLEADGSVNIGKVLQKCREHLDAGAGILDIGACSTGPGKEAVGADEEWRRLEPALRAIREEFPEVCISIDTYWSSVVEKTFSLIGPFIVNDISAGEADPEMLATAGRLGLTYVAMHMRGDSMNMQTLTDYPEGIVKAVKDYFSDFARKAEEAGIKDWILDPGFGFAKTVDQNYELFRALGDFQAFGKPVLVGISRKSMIYRLFGITPEEALPATQALHLSALEKGAEILRVHDTAEAARTVELYRRIC